jgi:hypothetical protein
MYSRRQPKELLPLKLKSIMIFSFYFFLFNKSFLKLWHEKTPSGRAILPIYC